MDRWLVLAHDVDETAIENGKFEVYDIIGVMDVVFVQDGNL